jgi:splicing factor 1
MAWRAQGSTGSNNIPLGNKRRFGGDEESPQGDNGYAPPRPSGSDGGYERGRSQVKGTWLRFPSAESGLIVL